jgi:hypothetical protein
LHMFPHYSGPVYVGNSHVVARNKNSPNTVHACPKRLPNWVLSILEYSWTTLSLGEINMEAWSTSLWLGVRLTLLPCKTAFVK